LGEKQPLSAQDIFQFICGFLILCQCTLDLGYKGLIKQIGSGFDFRKEGQHSRINNSHFISMCILRDLCQQKNPRELCQGSSPNLDVPIFPWNLFFPTKWERSKKIERELLKRKGRCSYSCVLLRFKNTLGCPSLRRMQCTHTGTSPTT
jgi:hypothetical protein